MRGHQPLIAMRRAGVMPAVATVSIDPVPQDLTTNWPKYGWPGSSAHAEIAVDADDSIGRLDLRFLVGLPMVWVTGTDTARLEALRLACIDAKAKRVVSVRFQPGKVMHETVEMTDTEGLLTWRN